MTRAASPFKLLAAVLALVMVTGVALPVVAYACDAMQAQVVKMFLCCGADEDPRPEMPCHDDAAQTPVHGESFPAEHMAVCCTGSDLVATSAAALVENPGAPAIQVSILDESPWAASEDEGHVTHPPVDEVPAGTGDGVGLHVLYGALLN
jgi:hypothetical protein